MNKTLSHDEFIIIIKKLRLNSDRYEKIRKLNLRQFTEIYNQTIATGEKFDDLVDKL